MPRLGGDRVYGCQALADRAVLPVMFGSLDGEASWLDEERVRTSIHLRFGWLAPCDWRAWCHPLRLSVQLLARNAIRHHASLGDPVGFESLDACPPARGRLLPIRPVPPRYELPWRPR